MSDFKNFGKGLREISARMVDGSVVLLKPFSGDCVDLSPSTLSAIAAWVDEQRGVARGPSVEVAVEPYTARISELEDQLAASKKAALLIAEAAVRSIYGHGGRK